MKYLISSWGIEKFRDVVKQYYGKKFEPSRDLPEWEFKSYLGWHEQGDGAWFCGLHVDSGRVGNQEKALQASWYLLKSGFHVMAIRPPTVPPNSCRLRVTLSAAHTTEDVKKLITALSSCLDFDNNTTHIPSFLYPKL